MGEPTISRQIQTLNRMSGCRRYVLQRQQGKRETIPRHVLYSDIRNTLELCAMWETFSSVPSSGMNKLYSWIFYSRKKCDAAVLIKMLFTFAYVKSKAFDILLIYIFVSLTYLFY